MKLHDNALCHCVTVFLNVVEKGHVDCTGTILCLDLDVDSLWVKVKLEEDTLRYLVPKGFVSVDGTSLTVCEVGCSFTCFHSHIHTIAHAEFKGDSFYIVCVFSIISTQCPCNNLSWVILENYLKPRTIFVV